MTKSRDNYNRLYELYTFINMLYNKQFTGMTYTDIAETFHWERKTIERMLNVVKTMMGDALRVEYMDDGSRRKVYSLSALDTAKLPPGFITHNDIMHLENAIKFLDNNTDIRNPLQALSAKLQRATNKRGDLEDVLTLSGVVARPRPRIETDKSILTTLLCAILEYKQVMIQYANKESTVCPLGFLFGSNNNYLVASNCKHMENQHMYILCNIKSVKITDAIFDAQGFDINQYAAKSFGVYHTDIGAQNIRWHASAKVADAARRFTFHPTQKITENADGSLFIDFYADGMFEMVCHLISWRGEIVPVAPSTLVDEYKKLLTQCADAIK